MTSQEVSPCEVQPQIVGAAEDPDADRDKARTDLSEVMFTRGRRKLGIILFLVSVIDLVASGIMMLVAFKTAYLDNGVSLYCLGLQAMSHWITSLLLVLRVAGEWCCCGEVLGNELEDVLLKKRKRSALVREQVLSIFMSIAMLVSAASLIFKAVRKMKNWDNFGDHKDKNDEAAFATTMLSWYGVATYSIHAGVRGVAAWIIRRHVLYHALTVSIISVLFLLVLGVAAIEETEATWKAEPIAAIILGLLTIAEAIRIVYYHFDDVDDRLEHDAEHC